MYMANIQPEGRGLYIRYIHREAMVYIIYSIANKYIERDVP